MGGASRARPYTTRCARLKRHPESTAHVQQLAGEPACLVGCEEHDDVRDVIGEPDTTERRAAGDALLLIGRDPARLDRTERDHVDRDAESSQLSSRCTA